MVEGAAPLFYFLAHFILYFPKFTNTFCHKPPTKIYPPQSHHHYTINTQLHHKCSSISSIQTCHHLTTQNPSLQELLKSQWGPFGGGSLTFAITQQMMLFKLNQHLNLILMNPFTHITNHPYVHLHSLIITQVHKCLHHQKCHHHFHQITTTLHHHHLPLNTWSSLKNSRKPMSLMLSLLCTLLKAT